MSFLLKLIINFFEGLMILLILLILMMFCKEHITTTIEDELVKHSDLYKNIVRILYYWGQAALAFSIGNKLRFIKD